MIVFYNQRRLYLSKDNSNKKGATIVAPFFIPFHKGLILYHKLLIQLIE
jgi:hypothetical protein